MARARVHHRRHCAILTHPSPRQSGWNICARNAWNQESRCQTAWINSLEDWCIWGPPEGGDIGSTERVAVAFCTTDKHGTRLIPDGTITGAHFVQTSSYGEWRVARAIGGTLC